MTSSLLNSIHATGVTQAPGQQALHGALPPASPFAQLLKTGDAAADRGQATHSDTARESARSLVASTLIQPILAQAHREPFKTGLFHGGRGEEAFQQQMDTIFAERITAKANFPVVDAVYQRVMQQAGRRTVAHG